MTPQFFGPGANLHELANALRSATRTKIPPASSRGHRRVDQFSAEPLADNGYARVLAQSRFAQCLAGQDALPRDPYFSHLKFVPEVLDAGSSWTYFLASPGRQCGTQDVPGVYAAVAAGQNDRLAVMGIFDQRGLPSTTCDSVFWGIHNEQPCNATADWPSLMRVSSVDTSQDDT